MADCEKEFNEKLETILDKTVTPEKENSTANGSDVTFTSDEMEQMFPGFNEKIAAERNKMTDEDGITIGNHHYTKEQLDMLTKHAAHARKPWTAAQKKARNKKNKAASKQRRANRLRSK